MDRRHCLGALLLIGAVAQAQELDPRTYSPAPVGTAIVVGGFGRSHGGFILDPSLGIDNVEADLWFTTTGFGYYFDLGGRQARVLAVLPVAWGDVSGEVGNELQRQDLEGPTDPRFKLSVGLLGAPALTLDELAKAPRRTVLGASLTVVPPWGEYSSAQLINLGNNRWAFKPEIGIAQPAGGFSLEAYAGVWLFTDNGAYFPGHAEKRQDPVVSLQGHIGRSLRGRAWLAFDGTWFSGGRSEVDGIASPDRQSNVRLGGTLSIPLTREQSIKLVYSTGTKTRRGSDYNTFSVTWQKVRFGKERRP
jgi:Putative MetA-pathway of phenol degradation